MNGSGVVQRHLSRFQDQIDRLRFIDCLNLLTPGQNIVFVESFLVRLYRITMTCRNHAHATCLTITRRQCQPRGPENMWLESHVGRVLVPANIVFALRFLDEQYTTPQRKTVANQVFDRIQN